jgi:hypothetical protein
MANASIVFYLRILEIDDHCKIFIKIYLYMLIKNDISIISALIILITFFYQFINEGSRHSSRESSILSYRISELNQWQNKRIF